VLVDPFPILGSTALRVTVTLLTPRLASRAISSGRRRPLVLTHKMSFVYFSPTSLKVSKVASL
jgi:hypothetical protein